MPKLDKVQGFLLGMATAYLTIVVIEALTDLPSCAG